MDYQYPVTLECGDNEVIATFKDIPEAITFGDAKEHALHEAEDVLLVALSAPFLQLVKRLNSNR